MYTGREFRYCFTCDNFRVSLVRYFRRVNRFCFTCDTCRVSVVRYFGTTNRTYFKCDTCSSLGNPNKKADPESHVTPVVLLARYS